MKSIVMAKVEIGNIFPWLQELNIVNMLNYYMSQGKNKRIPVSENVWKRLGELKGAGETYDEVIEKMIKDHNRMELARKMKNIEETEKEELIPLDEV